MSMHGEKITAFLPNLTAVGRSPKRPAAFCSSLKLNRGGLAEPSSGARGGAGGRGGGGGGGGWVATQWSRGGWGGGGGGGGGGA
jgi:hypothetical protein